MATVANVESSSRAGARSVYLGKQTVLAVVLGELRMILDTSDRGLVPHLLLDGFWESWVTVWILNNLKKGETALNIGANCGYYSVMMARQVGSMGRIVAIEPNETHARNIEHSMHLNGFHPYTTVIRAVASDAPGQRKFNMRDDGMSMNSAISAEGKQIVEAVRVDDVCPEATFAVIDTEGHEPFVWAGMRKIRSNSGFRAVIEWSPQRYSAPRRFYEELVVEGFSCSYIGYDGHEVPADESVMMDGVERMVVLRKV